MKTLPRIKPNEELTPLEKELFDVASSCGDDLHTLFAEQIEYRLNPIIRREGGMSQVHVWSFIGKIYNVFAARLLMSTQAIADDNGDNECTIKQFFEEFNYGTQLLLKIPVEVPNPHGIMPLTKPAHLVNVSDD